MSVLKLLLIIPTMSIKFNLFGKKSSGDRSQNAFQKLTPPPIKLPLSPAQLSDFLIGFCAAGDLKILNQPEFAQDRKKYVTIGTSVIFTALLAGCSGGYAFFTAVKAIDLSLGFAILWAATILNLDRSVLISMSPKPGKQPNFWQKLAAACPRLVLSVAIGVVVSTPLTLKVFEKEITAQIEQDFIQVEKVQTEKKAAEKQLIEAKLRESEHKIKELEQTKSTRFNELNQEIQGKVGSGKEGKGAASAALEANIKVIEADLAIEQAAKIQEQQKIQPEIDRIERKYARESQVRQDSDGLLNRLEALDKIKHHNRSANVAVQALELLLIAIEVAPMLIKLMSKDGNYEEAIKLAQENLSKQNKLQAENNAIVQAQQESIDLKYKEDEIERQLLLAESSKNPQNLSKLTRTIELDLFKLDLYNKIFDKFIESIERKQTSQQEFDNSLLEYGANLSLDDRATYLNIFTKLQNLSQEDLYRTVTLLKSGKPIKAA
jgi:Domain of unknown function (DUF4407)